MVVVDGGKSVPLFLDSCEFSNSRQLPCALPTLDSRVSSHIYNDQTISPPDDHPAQWIFCCDCFLARRPPHSSVDFPLCLLPRPTATQLSGFSAVTISSPNHRPAQWICCCVFPRPTTTQWSLCCVFFPQQTSGVVSTSKSQRDGCLIPYFVLVPKVIHVIPCAIMVLSNCTTTIPVALSLYSPMALSRASIYTAFHLQQCDAHPR